VYLFQVVSSLYHRSSNIRWICREKYLYLRWLRCTTELSVWNLMVIWNQVGCSSGDMRGTWFELWFMCQPFWMNFTVTFLSPPRWIPG
jgi:hypothetical protein